ncbi:MAG: hypothetical protein A3E07_02550 [Candidatus Wildermuthbacteria bacterium RIFCSPHIGHO2_12_FULL_45_9]|uniref:Uncharacterized protein n=1 Tax=Candidatus Wildermuthbacteria bacterium RIFCSPHIGHO2_02_FULL_45_25 TaxID=1802450 RepID=A0A1G2R4P5_9BACT|nr:MAG: hypothetical protein A2748_01735 [Candidatus Wildermuthbacteria bacterium RIFCSPHIGHO2_01_FULL_45_20]OHA67825.1 MAG: hypothetical protein A3C04_04260 [Candidatus Wildermuthbacteria bacterium RIFCSPHIGHO2_02_FULL_45_25]OHA71831.1 MAG: hypothetical protein A3E07_02550 [Candidatus Wildermuthbacteria bacterium RIFCSPHIGHO2_12_FULL_45_9]
MSVGNVDDRIPGTTIFEEEYRELARLRYKLDDPALSREEKGHIQDRIAKVSERVNPRWPR